VETALPVGVAEDDSVGPAEVFFFRGEVTAEEGRDLEDLQKARGDERDADSFGKWTGDFGEVVGVVAADGGEGGVGAVPILEANRSDEAIRVAVADVVLIEGDEAIAVGVRE
jgi:hypothetical protein